MASHTNAPDRTLNEWYDYIEAERRKGVNWRTRVWWMRQWMYRVGTAERARIWWKNAKKESARHGKLVEDWMGLSRRDQLLQMARLKIKHDIPPEDYYGYRLYRPDRQQKSGQFLRFNRQVRLIRYLIDSIHPPDDPTGDKRKWHRWAAKHSVSTPRVLATFSNGEVTPWGWDGSPESLRSVDLFCKWTNLYRGEGAECWLYRDGRYEDMANPNRSLTQEQLVRHLRAKSKERPVVMQERIVHHENLKPFTSGALPTARLITGRYPAKSPCPIVAAFKMPVGDSMVDNTSAGCNLVAQVDIATGELGAAISAYPNELGDEIHHHPDTGCQITGAVIPNWKEIVDLAISTHDLLKDTPFVGWDITLGQKGPIIIEPNNGWGPTGPEKPSGVPLTDTLYQPMYDAWMQLHVNDARA